MLYYRVKPEYDQRSRWRFIGHSNLKGKPDGILIANELYTPTERSRLMNHDKMFEIVRIQKNKIYWCFGARFRDGDGQ